ncbi:MAG: CAP domain-containing protein [Acidimicrobiia bacterium]
MHLARRIAATLLTPVVLSFGLATAPALAASGESSFLSRMNAERTARGLAPVEMYWDLVDDARAHSQRMAAQGSLHHNPSLGGVTGGWMALGENVGVGPEVATVHEAFMDSAGHRRNVLGDFNYVGVGVVVENADKLWVTVVFMKGAPGLVSPPVEDPPAADPPAEDPVDPPGTPEEPSAADPPPAPPPVAEEPATAPAPEPPPPEDASVAAATTPTPGTPSPPPTPAESVSRAVANRVQAVPVPIVRYGSGRLRPIAI